MERKIGRKTWKASTALMALLFGLSAFGTLFSALTPVSVWADDSVTVGESGGAKTYEINGAVRVTPLSETVVRLEEKGKNGFEDRDTYYVLGRDEFTAPSSSLNEANGEYVISAGDYVVHIGKTASDLGGAYVTDAQGTVLYRYNGVTLPNTYMPSPSDDLRGWYFCDYPRIVPGDNGYSVTNDGLALNGWDFESEAPDVYVFVPEDYANFCKDYVTLTGKSNLIDLKTFGFWDSRWYVYDYESVVQQVKDYLDRGYSIDMITIDTNWREGSVNSDPNAEPSTGGKGYNIDKNLFPHMEETLQQLHDLGVNVIFNDHPEPVQGTSNGLEAPEIEYRSKNLKLILGMGLDMWWYDRNWSTALNSADKDLSVFAWGMYAFQFIENEYYEQYAESNLEEYARRAIIMGNVDGCLHGNWKYGSDLSAHRYTMQWTGDIGVDEHALSLEIRDAVYGSAENGIPYISSDLGGHTSAVTDDMYARWLQYGALSTITRVHCTHVYYCHQEGRMPWLFGDKAENVTKEYVGMKYNLMPMYYSLAAENANTGLPILRRLDIAYPQYAEASRNDEYLLGDGIVIAPINEAYVKSGFDSGFFTHEEKGVTKNGLLGEYFSGKEIAGSPVYTQTDTNFVLDWGQAGPKGLGNDNFSIRWTGNFHVGDVDTKLTFFADDRVRVRIDGSVVVNSAKGDSNQYDVLFETDYYSAHTDHTITVEYTEEGNYAHFYMYGIERASKGASYCYDSREVFLPDGIWIDVWSGKEYTGPYTYTVTHPLETSPIFVRKGALNVLAPDMKNLSEKDWSNLTLDAYPAAFETSAHLYEDDTVTQAYKYGKSRTTEITASAANGKYTVHIGAAVGEFDGDRAFTDRKWNLRLHAFKELGAVKSVTVNGKPVNGLSYSSRDSMASPFSFSGASPDTAVYEVSFACGVYEEATVVVDFEHNDKLAALARNEDYNADGAEFSLDVKSPNGAIDFDKGSYDDWAFFGSVTARKNGADLRIGDLTSDFEMYDAQKSAIAGNWTGADGVSEGYMVMSARSGQVDAKVTLFVKAGETKKFTLYLVSEYCVGKLTVRDRAGNVQTVILDGDGTAADADGLNENMNGVSSKKVVITVTAEKDTELYVRYSVHSSVKDGGSGTGSAARVGISAIVCANAEANDEELVFPEVEASSVTQTAIGDSDTFDLDAYEGGAVSDWYKTNYNGEDVYMEGGSDITAVSFTQKNSFGDFHSVIKWENGENGVECTAGSTSGFHTDSNGKIELTVIVDEHTDCIVIYAGAWHGSAKVELFDANGASKGSTQWTATGDGSSCKKVVIPISAKGKTIVRVVITSVGAHDGGNASLAAAQVVRKEGE